MVINVLIFKWIFLNDFFGKDAFKYWLIGFALVVFSLLLKRKKEKGNEDDD